MRRSAIWLVAAAGCFHADAPGSPASPPATPPEATAYEQLEARMPLLLASFDGLADALVNAGTRCDLMAAVLRRWGLDNRAELDQLAAIKLRLTVAEREHFELEHSDDPKRMHAVLEAVESCRGDVQVATALELAGFPPARRK